MQSNNEQFDLSLAAFCETMNKRDKDRVYSVSPGGVKFKRVYRAYKKSSWGSCAPSVYCFVNVETGAFHKAEGWKKPVAKPKTSLGTIFSYDPESFDPYGSCFYAR